MIGRCETCYAATRPQLQGYTMSAFLLGYEGADLGAPNQLSLVANSTSKFSKANLSTRLNRSNEEASK
jgi:hypothetical protein